VATARLPIERQPDDTTCGPTALHAVYRHWGLDVALPAVVQSVATLPRGGTLGVLLGLDALARGFAVTIHTCNLSVFDPSWFGARPADLRERLAAYATVNTDPKRAIAIDAYGRFLAAGGRVLMSDLTRDLLRLYLDRHVPLLTGLSATWLYRAARELPDSGDADDLRGEPAGHFVVLSEHDPASDRVAVADPWEKNPLDPSQHYHVQTERLLAAILLGVITYDANLVAVEPRSAASA
jgi:hypothetical protein